MLSETLTNELMLTCIWYLEEVTATLGCHHHVSQHALLKLSRNSYNNPISSGDAERNNQHCDSTVRCV